VEHYFQAIIEAIRLLEPDRLEEILEEASLELSRPVILEELLEPLMYAIGDMWKTGDLKVVHEHMASAVVRSFLGNMNTAQRFDGSAPRIIITTPPGQMHEFGALMISISAIKDGWNAIYLGPNIPVDQIAAAARLENTRAVALSVVYPSDDPRIDAELKRLRRLVGDDMTILIGGRAAIGYNQTSKEIGAIRLDNLADFRKTLESLRNGLQSE
jgi:methanogenic corrinoid protein MtbC1